MKTEHLTITPMRRSDIGECAELSVQAFVDYEYFTNFYTDREARLAFMRAMIRSESKAVAVADLFAPDWKKPSDLQYLLHGWGRVLRLPQQDVVKEWLAMDERAGRYCHSLLGGTTWYLSSLTVSPDQQGKGFGREMLMDCVIPYVKVHGGTRLCFFTNSESNLHFYQHLGFEVTDYQELDCRGNRMGSWSFAMECR